MSTLQEMTSELLAAGMTEAELAKALKTSQATVNRISRGTTPDPGYSLGKRIEAVYESICRQAAPDCCSGSYLASALQSPESA